MAISVCELKFNVGKALFNQIVHQGSGNTDKYRQKFHIIMPQKYSPE